MTEVRDRGCSRAQAWASLELDGELSQLESVLLERHLERCPACAEHVNEVRAVTRALRAAPLEAPSEPVFVAASRRSRVRPVAVRVGIAATLALAAGGLGVLAGSVGGGEPAQEPAEQELVLVTPDDRRDIGTPREVPQPPDRGPGPRLGGV